MVLFSINALISFKDIHVILWNDQKNIHCIDLNQGWRDKVVIALSIRQRFSYSSSSRHITLLVKSGKYSVPHNATNDVMFHHTSTHLPFHFLIRSRFFSVCIMLRSSLYPPHVFVVIAFLCILDSSENWIYEFM